MILRSGADDIQKVAFSGVDFLKIRVVGDSVHIGEHSGQQPVGVGADLVGGAIVDAQRLRLPPDVDAQRLPRERLLENALAKITGKEQPFGTFLCKGYEKQHLGHADILGLVADGASRMAACRHGVRPGGRTGWTR